MLSLTEMAVTINEADAYAQSRGHSNWLDAEASPDDAREAALRRGQDAIAGMFNARWSIEFENDDAPERVKMAIVEAAIRELANPGSMTPDQARGGRIKSVGAGSARVEYMDSAPAETVFLAIENLLRGLVTPKGGTIVGFAARA
jgi:rhamnose utilization protein RhaD (predicted bifunctional aldolase and dehydrogenase)